MVQIIVEGADELIKKLTSLQSMQSVKSAIQLSAKFIQGKIKQYPPERHGPNPNLYGPGEKAQRMRAGYFARLKSGAITVPYARGASGSSEKLGQSWTTEPIDAGFGARIGTNVSYAKLVQSAAGQAGYHRQTGWITDQQVVDMYGTDVVEQINSALKREIDAM